MTTSIMLFALIIVGIAGFAAALWVQLRESSRREAVDRALGTTANAEIRRALRKGMGGEDKNSLRERMLRKAPSAWAQNQTVQNRLVQAGYDGATAPMAYSLLRVGALVCFPLLALVFIAHNSFMQLLVVLGGAAMVGLMLPPLTLMRLMAMRQEKIRKSLPDSLDLLVVCVEAGISLDAAILRVAKDLSYVHPALASELMIVSRKTNAGMTREDALRGFWERTGVEEVRSVVASLVQSEKWGSSSSRALRVSADTLRRKRRHSAERRAATAPLKMIVPMALFIFPALFVVVLGPAVLQIVSGFSDK